MPTMTTRAPRRHLPLHPPSVRDEGIHVDTVLTRLRGGTFSPTVGRVRFDDGQVALTDVIRLTPDVDAYSLDYHGESPRHVGHYRVADWSEASRASLARCEREVVWILAHSYPTIDTATLSAQLRSAGYAIGPADIPIHEAIAATQAALWHFTDGLRLDRSAIGDIDTTVDGSASPVRTWDPRAGTRVAPNAPAVFTAQVAGTPLVTSYTVDLASTVPDDLELRLERSVDGRVWQAVATSSVFPAKSGVRGSQGLRVKKGLGAGATTWRSTHGRAIGYGHYRVVAQTTSTTADVVFASIGIDFADAAAGSNPTRVVQLSDYLREGARRAARGEADVLRGPRSVLRTDLDGIGSFSLDPHAVGACSVTARSETGDVLTVLDERGDAVTVLEGGERFFIGDLPLASRGRIHLDIDVLLGWTHRGRLLQATSPAADRTYTTLGLATRSQAPRTRIRRSITWRSATASEPAVPARLAL